MAETLSDAASIAPQETADGTTVSGSAVNRSGTEAIPDPPANPSRVGLGLSAVLAGALAAGVGVIDPDWLLSCAWAGVASSGLGLIGIPWLQAWKTGQVIRAEGPQSHLKKAGTPTMGGILFIPVGIVVAGWATQWDPDGVAVGLLTLGCALIGWFDDLAVIQKQSNKGLSPPQKLGLQLFLGLIFCGWMAWSGVSTDITLPGLGSLSLGWGYWLLAVFVLTGTPNAVNLTDGMDGLAAGVVAIILVGLGSLAWTGADPELAGWAWVMAAACLGFLAHNRNPARVFMGDTGSLGLGGALAGVALVTDQLWALAVMGGILIFETLSVVIQVSYFKYTKRKTGEGKRLFRMSPFHHHLELSGWSEIQVVGCFYLVTGILTGGAWWLNRITG